MFMLYEELDHHNLGTGKVYFFSLPEVRAERARGTEPYILLTEL